MTDRDRTTHNKDMRQDRQDRTPEEQRPASGFNRSDDARNRAHQEAASRPGVDAANALDDRGHMTATPHEGLGGARCFPNARIAGIARGWPGLAACTPAGWQGVRPVLRPIRRRFFGKNGGFHGVASQNGRAQAPFSRVLPASRPPLGPFRPAPDPLQTPLRKGLGRRIR